MPVYQYACTECGEPLEIRQSFTDESLTVCPACGGRLRKVLSPVGVVFKGSGFYRTDSRAASAAANKPAGSDKTDKTSVSADSSGTSSAGAGSGTNGSSSSSSSGSASTTAAAAS